MTVPDMSALWLTLRLAAVSTAILLVIATPVAWWLATTRTRLKPAVEAVIALPIVLPPTVLGFYLLIAFNPSAPIGGFWLRATGDTLTFSFTGLVIASVLYSLPFAVQPLQAAFESVARDLMEAAASLRAAPLDAFLTVAAPLSVRGFVTAGVLSFAHTLGEFGVVLMVGGNIPGETRVVSIAIYEQVETLHYAEAHALSAVLLAVSFAVLLFVYVFNRRYPVHVR
ncbi:MAG: molybdate ABC transporter permease subunit [Caulobacterales bacterium]|nr:molybdate ABC transporter permease subunit [Caulobacterales bacterium]